MKTLCKVFKGYGSDSREEVRAAEPSRQTRSKKRKVNTVYRHYLEEDFTATLHMLLLPKSGFGYPLTDS
jgi:hypothetical protein